MKVQTQSAVPRCHAHAFTIYGAQVKDGLAPTWKRRLVICQFSDGCVVIVVRAEFVATFMGRWRALIRGPPLLDGP